MISLSIISVFLVVTSFCLDKSFEHLQQYGWTFEGIMLSEMRFQKDKYHMISLTYGILKKAHRYREKIEDSQRQGWGRRE